MGLNYLNHISSFRIPKHPFFQEADILHFHNLHTGYFNYLAIPALTREKPAVFTLRDMWGITGHCSYSYDCERWKTGCGKCPHPDTYPEILVDSSGLEWRLKQWSYRRSNLTIVGISRWLTEQARSSILSCFPVYHIANGIDTESYQPLNLEKCRFVLGLPANKKVLLFGAHNLKAPRKGVDLLVNALRSLPGSLKNEIVLLTMGTSGDSISEITEMATINLGFLSSDRLKSIAYSAADLFLFPTRQDAFGLVAQEAVACGTPVVSFNGGGVPDIVRPGITGYLAEPENTKDFAAGIVQLLEDDGLRRRMENQCREIALREYALEQQTKKYLDLYHHVLGTYEDRCK
jgi:glycosyltransferase involved in cell wall biosynthesis